ncbi:MAG TPA: DNA polymerase I [Vicinamibacterales bacterium]|jgi:DNA polymerase-1|nr:DNA polymerase I [Vicinamibacterales bacterium]
MAAKPIVYLIDGSSQMYRAYHAPVRTADGGLLRNAKGQPTNAVYIFVTMLRKLLNEHAPQYIAASFDLPGRTFRDDLVSDYKANRTPMPDELAQQITMVHAACEALGVPILTSERYEADDVIGTLAVKASAAGFDVAIVTLDKDFFQLVGGGIRVFNPRDEGTWYDIAGVKEKLGVTPEQVVDVMALMGDTIDNIKGVPGIGDKGARELIATYGTMENLLVHAAEIKNKRYREGLLGHAEDARQSQVLARIRTDVPVEFDPEAVRYRGGSRERSFVIFNELGFRSLAKEYAPTADTTAKTYRTVNTPEDLRALADRLRAAGSFALRVLPDQPGATRAAIVGLAFSTAPREADYVPTGHRALGATESVPIHVALDALRSVLEDPSIAKVGHDLKFDAIMLARHGVTLRGLDLDTMIASYLIDATRSEHKFDELALEYTSYKTIGEEDICGRGAKAMSLAEVPAEAVVDYAGERADLTGQLVPILRKQLETDQLMNVYETLELPLIPVLMAVERAGIRVDGPLLAAQSQKLEQELAQRTAQIYGLAGGEFNIGSPKQLSEILFDKMQLPVLKRTGTSRAPSTAVEVLEELALAHDLPRHILEWRALMKLKGTYIDALPQLVNPDTGRVHTCFNQAVAATGRLSSSDPNLQNIPIKTALGREIRRAFIAEPGNVLISADYSQIEFRVLAHMSQDPVLVDAFREGADFHERTALKIFGADSGRDPHQLRSVAKMVNYALLYGKSAFTLSKDIGVTPDAAQEFIDGYFAGFPRVRAFIDRTLEEGRATGIVKTLYGRRRLVPELNSRNFQIRSAAERMAVNMPIQGTAADIMKRAMIDVHAALAAHPDARMILTVHDELLFEVPQTRADELAAIVQEKMQSAARLEVPLTVDVGIGGNWKDAKS